MSKEKGNILERAAALFLDTFIILAFVVIVMILHTKVFFSVPPLWLLIVEWGIPFYLLLYFALFEYIKGATPGKLLMNLKVVTLDGGKISLFSAVVRNISRIFNMFFMIDYISAFLTEKHQRLGDILAKTKVENCSDKAASGKSYLILLMMPFVFIGFLIFAMWLSGSFAPNQYAKYNNAEYGYNYGLENFNTNKKESIKYFSQCLDIFPNHVSALYGRQLCYQNVGEKGKQHIDLNKILEIAPDYGPAYYSRAAAYFKENKYKNALKDLDKAILLPNNLTKVYYLKAKVLGKMGDHKGSKKYMRLSQNNKLKMESIDAGFGYTLSERDFEAAGLTINKITHIHWDHSDAFFYKGFIAFKEGEVEKALKHFDKSIVINPTKEKTYVYRAFLKHKFLKKEEAFEDLNVFFTLKGIANPIYYMADLEEYEEDIKLMMIDYKKYKKDQKKKRREELKKAREKK